MFEKTKEIDMVHGPLAGKLLLFTIPLICSNLLQILFNAADVIVVGRFAGDHSLAAVGSTSSLIALIVQLFVGLSIGANVAAARAIGEGQEKQVRSVVSTAVAASIVSGFVLLVFGISTSKMLLVWMGTPDEVCGLAVLYMRIYFVGMPFLMLYNFGSALLRAMGDTRRPLYFLLISGVINVVLNCIFVIALHMDVAGVALATVISEGISAALILRCLIRDDGILHLDWRHMAVDSHALKQMIRIGLPAGIQGTLFSLSNVVIQSSVNSFGAVVMAGSAAAVNIGNFVYMSLNAFHQAALSFNGQNMGAEEFDRVDRVTGLCVLYVTVLGLVLSTGAYVFGPELLRIYTTNPEVVAAGMVRMKYCIMLYWLCGMMDVMPGCIRGMGFSLTPMVVSLLGSCVFRLVWVATIFPMQRTIENLYLSYPVSWILTFAIHIVCYVILRRKLRTMYDKNTVRNAT